LDWPDIFTHDGTKFTPRPMPKAIITMNLFLLVNPSLRFRTWIPETTTLVKRKVVIPPKTQFGIERIIAANLEKIPNTNSHIQHANPARRDAQREREITPLFWAYVVTGVIVPSAARKVFNPSANIAPLIDFSKLGPNGSR
jgi:hypothetical protein